MESTLREADRAAVINTVAERGIGGHVAEESVLLVDIRRTRGQTGNRSNGCRSVIRRERVVVCVRRSVRIPSCRNCWTIQECRQWRTTGVEVTDEVASILKRQRQSACTQV